MLKSFLLKAISSIAISSFGLLSSLISNQVHQYNDTHFSQAIELSIKEMPENKIKLDYQEKFNKGQHLKLGTTICKTKEQGIAEGEFKGFDEIVANAAITKLCP